MRQVSTAVTWPVDEDLASLAAMGQAALAQIQAEAESGCRRRLATVSLLQRGQLTTT